MLTPPDSPVLKRSSAASHPELLELAGNASGTRAVPATAPRFPDSAHAQVVFHDAVALDARAIVAEQRAAEVQDLQRGRQLWNAGPAAMELPELEKFRDDLLGSPNATYAITRTLIGAVQAEIASRGIQK
jgi:hypothetical protein